MAKDMTRVIFGKPVALWRAFLWDGIKFGLVGLSSIAIYFVILFLLQPFVDSVALLAALSYIGSAVFNYFGQSKVTFNSDVRDYGAFLRYVAMHGLCIVINSTGMHFMVTVWLAVAGLPDSYYCWNVVSVVLFLGVPDSRKGMKGPYQPVNDTPFVKVKR